MSSDFIEFENEDGEKEAEEASEVDIGDIGESGQKSIETPVARFMFIQMELCEKQTLKDAIDSKSLLKDHKRITRLFREVVEGLAYLHDSGIIHRGKYKEFTFHCN
jgi:translation initiation factor 2-alpha kinase 4